MNINKITTPFEENKLTLDNPGRLQGGSYYCKIKYDGRPFYLQTPVVSTKQGIKQTSKKMYCDLMFEQTDNFTTYIENLETSIKQKLFERSKLWFYNDLDEDDIDMFYHSCMRNYKFKYQLLRTYINKKTLKNNENLEIYDEDQILRTKDDILNKNVICIIKLKGITFTKTSFSLNIDLVQVMILENHDTFNKCMIQKDVNEKTLVNCDSTNNTDEINNATYETTSVDISQNIEESLGKTTVTSVYTDDQTDDTIKKVNDENKETKENSDNIQIENISNEEQTVTQDIETPNKEDTLSEGITVTEKEQAIDTDENNGCDNTDVINDVSDITNEEKNEVTIDTIIQEHKNSLEELDDTKTSNTNSDDILELNLDNIIPDEDKEDNIMKEVSNEILTHDTHDTIKLKDRRDVYYEIYEQAHKKAKVAKQLALQAYLEARQIKNQYLINEGDSSSDDEDLDNLSVYTEDDLLELLHE